MPRNYVRSRRTRRRRTAWYNKRYSTLQIAKKAWAATKYIKGLINSERMYFDQTLSLSGVQSRIVHLTYLGQGDTAANRTGNSVLLRSIYLRGFMSINPAVVGNTRVSLILVRDNQQISDTTPAITDVLRDNDPDSLLNTNASGRFKIVWRKNYTLFPQSTGAGSTKEITKYIKVYDHVRYNGPLPTDVQKHGYYLLMVTSENTNFPTIQFTNRIGYHDN